MCEDIIWSCSLRRIGYIRVFRSSLSIRRTVPEQTRQSYSQHSRWSESSTFLVHTESRNRCEDAYTMLNLPSKGRNDAVVILYLGDDVCNTSASTKDAEI